MADDPTLTRSQELIKEFNYNEQEDVEGCVERWSIQLGKDLHMDYSDIDYESRENNNRTVQVVRSTTVIS